MTRPVFRYSARGMRVFDGVFQPWRRRRLATCLAGARPWRHGGSVVMVANHVSWWDGFLLRDVHRRLGDESPLFTVMLEEELARRPFLRRLGAVGIVPGRRGSIRGLLRGLEGLRERYHAPWLSFFPQGRIRPSWARPLRFQPGIQAVLRRLEGAAVLPVALHLEPLNRVRPTAFVSVGPALAPQSDRSPAALERAVEAELDRILSFIRVHGEEAPAQWPAPTERLPSPLGGGARVILGGVA